MEKFEIDPNEEKRRHDKILEKIDPQIAKILRGHLTYPPTPEQEKKAETVPETPKDTPHHKGAGAFIENSIPESNR
jgi:hypothetical protein